MNKSERMAACEYILKHGGAVSYLLASRIMKHNEGRVSDYLALSLNDDKVKYWINKLLENRPNPNPHDSKDNRLENAASKLLTYGIRKESTAWRLKIDAIQNTRILCID